MNTYHQMYNHIPPGDISQADAIANRILRIRRRRLVVKQITEDATLTRGTIAALWRTAQHADNYRLIRWAMEGKE